MPRPRVDPPPRPTFAQIFGNLAVEIHERRLEMSAKAPTPSPEGPKPSPPPPPPTRTFVACFEHNIPYPAGGQCPFCEKKAEKKKVTPLDIVEEEFERLDREEGHGVLRDHDYLMAVRHFEELRERLTARFSEQESETVS